MAVTLVTTIKRYEGTAAEMAAMVVTSVPAGSTFFQNDTGLIFNLSAAGAWTEKKTNGTVQLYGSNLQEATVLNVVTAGLRVQLPDCACHEVTIIAKRVNTGYMYVGESNVSSSVYGVELAAKDSFTFQIANTNQLYIDASVSGEGISYVAI